MFVFVLFDLFLFRHVDFPSLSRVGFSIVIIISYI
nr:MAG TPA: hypothetical protein [Crassvirales sp.]